MKLGDWIALLCLIITLMILWQFRQILLLIFTAIVLAIALNSFVRPIQNLGLGRGKAVLLALSLVLLFGVLFVSLVMPPFLAQFQELIQLVPIGFEQFINWIEQLMKKPPSWLPRQEQIELPDLSDLTQQIGVLVQNVLGNFFALFSNSLTTVLQLLLVIVLTLMLLVNPTTYRRTMVRLFPSFYRQRAEDIISRCEIALLNWMAGIVINSIFVATLSGIGLWILGIRFVLAHALMAGIFNLIPNIGPVSSVVFPISVALLDAPWKAIAIIILYLVIQNIESYWFSPMIMQKQVSLLPAATLTAQIFFTRFLGFLGLVLALPLTVVAKTWIEEALIKDILDQQGDSVAPKLLEQVETVECDESIH